MDELKNGIKQITNSPLDALLSGSHFPGGILLIVAICLIIIIIAIDKGVRGAVEDLPEWLYKFLDYVGTLGVITLSLLTGIMLKNRWDKSNKTIPGMLPGMLPVDITGSSERTSNLNHPFYVTGSSEYNDTKTVSDNYLPTI